MKISIPEPCHENWQNMLPSDKGRFCLSCQKEVIDFSVMTKHEIEAYFKSLPSNVCGRFKENQLTDINKELPAVNTKLSLKPWWMAASLFVFAKNSISQANNLAIDSSKQNIELNKDVVKTKQEVVDTIQYKHVIKGRVVDKETGESIIGANVVIENPYIISSTDIEGYFSLFIKNDNIDSLLIKVSYLGYQTDTIIVNNNVEDLFVELELTKLNAVFIGLVYHKPSIWRRIGNFFARPFRRRF